MHTFNPATWEAEIGSFELQGQCGLQDKFQKAKKPYFEKNKQKKLKTKKTGPQQ